MNACGHAAPAAAARLCAHLLDAVPRRGDVGWVCLLSGQGLQGDLACGACARLALDERVLVVACQSCVAVIEGDLWYFEGFRGEPGIGERPEPIDDALSIVELPQVVRGALNVAAAPSSRSSRWLALSASGEFVVFDLDTGSAETIAVVPEAVAAEPTPRLVIDPRYGISDEDIREREEQDRLRRTRRRLLVAANGGFAAVVSPRGSRGVVVDLERGAVTLRLDRGNSHVDVSDFSCAFAEDDGQTVVVHASAWNRLDVSDATTGRLLTPRHTPGRLAGQDTPDHYLDYFHGALSVSPSGRWIADDGWVWHPLGVVRCWDLQRWLHDTVWESEDGATVRAVCSRSYYWGAPMCWLDDRRLVVTGIGFDDDHIIPGVRVFDVDENEELLAFVGPQGQLFSDALRLYSANPDGVQIWNPRTGHRTARLPGFVPTHHNPWAAELVCFAPDHATRWQTPAADGGGATVTSQ